ncbi:hypothetical protein [Nocardia bovistercoris]|uniref:Uncharacterized protein n=1 Tax=Nocardia bovistercoris TaxID=2785916 RepID=A0A931I562_9NOCA|nr:hypothetical protein [Nocardia bovistercoris]MBH0775062.1 hypothetical protein [Nocardia bovistercoris]
MEAEYARLDVVNGVLTDMIFAAGDAMAGKDWRGVEFERARQDRAAEHGSRAYAEEHAVWDRLLDYRYDAQDAAEIRARVAADGERRKRGREGRSR